MGRDKLRIRFRKTGDLRLVSHHDLMRCFERMLRRAGLPFHSTQGFNPRPQMAFALSLPLGVVGCEEVLDLELDDALPPEEVHDRLSAQAPPGLEIRSVQRIDRKTPAQVRRATYRMAVPPERTADLSRRWAELLAAPRCPVDRTRPHPRRVDIRPYLDSLQTYPDAVEFTVWVTPTGTARPDEVLGLLSLTDLLVAGAVLERTKLELQATAAASAAEGIPAAGPSPAATVHP